LNEAGHLLMEDGRCPDKDWAAATKTLRECSSVVLAKIADKDAEGSQRPIGDLIRRSIKLASPTFTFFLLPFAFAQRVSAPASAPGPAGAWGSPSSG
jgi:hypothetical protein